ncbi:MAG: hypothetical protein J6T86_04500 [Bacteroidales bacterium]|nr:hypothetical protein [Bacteroidales bacterium]
MKNKKCNCIYLGKRILLLLTLMIPLWLFSQGREYIRSQIKAKGECRNVAITQRNGDLMLYGKNGWASTGCPKSLTDALDELNDEKQYIDDVQLTEAGRWLILYGNNGFRWNDIPYSLERKIREYNSDNEVITSVTFNDAGDWIVISKNYYTASDYRIQAWLKEGNEEYGQLWAACITEDACVAVFETGYLFLGDVPTSLKKALEETRLNVFRLKIAGDSWFFADFSGNYRYNM